MCCLCLVIKAQSRVKPNDFIDRSWGSYRLGLVGNACRCKMSEFDRTGIHNRSIRRPRKSMAPAPPVSQPPGEVSSILKRLIITQRDWQQTPPSPAVASQQRPSPSPVENVTAEDDSSHSALMALQKQINQIEFNTAVQRTQAQTESPRPPVAFAPHKGRTRYDEMESLLKTGISDLMTNSEDEDGDDTGPQKFYRGGGVRSSIQGVPANQIDPKKLKQSRPVARTASDSTQVDLIRKQYKQREIEKVKAEHEKKASDQVKPLLDI